MKMQFKFGAILLLSASLFYGFAARAQGLMQTERVSYALTLIDAGADGNGNTKTGRPVTADTENVRIKVTVSVPRTEGSSYYSAIPTYASPARLMFRKHRGPSTAFDGTIPLTRDAPYTNASGTASATDKYYPMPQSDADGYSITDVTKLNFTAVQSNAAKNLDGVDYNDYIGLGQAHDLGRWEATYLSESFNVAEVLAAADDADANILMVRSLLRGEATYEWFAASRRGLGSVARISDIQDVGRNMTFRDIRLWTPQGTESINIDESSQLTLGKYENWVSAAMPEGWAIVKGTIGSNYTGIDGAQLLNDIAAQGDLSDAPQVISPVYPDGVSKITFSACTTAEDTDTASTLLVQYSTFNGEWKTLQEVTLAAGLQTFTISFGDVLPEGADARFRLVRNAKNLTGGSANVHTYVIRNLLVRSATPKATFSTLSIKLTDDATSAEPHAGATFTVSVQATATTGKAPRGYKGVIQLRRRANDDNARVWYNVPATVAYNPTTGDGSLTATLTPGTLLTNPDGSLNVAENAFFTDADGNVTGVMAGVYDVAIQCGVLGSFEAGREEVDGYEAEPQTLDGYDVEEMDANNLPVTVHYPYVLNVRERPAVAKSVFMRVMYRTGNSVDNYDIDTFDVPLLPSSKATDVWRVDLEKTLKLAEPTAVYAWGYESNDPDNPEVQYEVGYISFKLCAEAADGSRTWYGLNSAITSAATRPAPVEVVPAVAETLKTADSEESAVPVLVAVGALPNSHLMVELNLADPQAAVANMAGAFWQDFNVWDPSEVFCETEYRENVTSVTADFNSEIVTQDGETKLVAGWIPDEGPLADTTAFTDEVAVGRLSQNGQFPFILRDKSYISDTRHFASWGATPERAEPKYMRVNESDSLYSDYLQFSSKAEVVLRRGIHSFTGNVYRSDAMFRLTGLSASVSPRHDTASSITLNGVGKVSFNLSLSLPYDINTIAQIVSSGDDILGYKGAGLSASVSFTNPSQTCAPSGYSVSYYLIDYSNPLSVVLYELRVSQVMEFPTTESEKPRDMVVMELYKWANGTPTRQTLRRGNAGGVDELYHEAGASLANNTYGLWLMADGRIAIGTASGTTSDTLTTQAVSKEVLVTNATSKQLNFALGSAECRPIFRQIDRITAAGANYNGSPIAADAVTVMTPSYDGARSIWKVAADTTSSARVQISRLTPVASQAGRVKVTARSANVTKTYDFYTDKMDQLCELTVGAANAELTIEPYDENCNVFIDNIAVSSWCGNDNNRNGRDRVPLFTDEGFNTNTGFMGVGVWIRPEEDDQLNSLPVYYTGRQCLLMQRSRQNNTYGYGEVTTEGVKHTGNAMALYLPYSDKGYGPISFRYRIPQYDEYGKQGELPSVRVMLQYTDDGPYSSFLGTNIPGESEWENASAPIELRNTGGEWSMVSITPKLNGAELVGMKGTLRLVMVISGDMDATDDPYVYIDDVRVTTNESGSSASWTATNVRVAATPINTLYWKDRLATEGASPAEETFAQKSTLTRGMQFNDVMTDEETEGSYATTVIESPILDNGAGRVTFAARLAEPQTKPVRLYICATTDPTDAKAGLQPVTYVEVANTVYTTYDIDLSKYQYYYTVPNADGSPSATYMGDAFSCSTIRRLTIKAFVEGDGVQSDGFGATPSYGRVLIDQLAVANPVLPSVRVASVAFSNLPGTNSANEFDARSPLSQPVQNASILRAMVRLDRAQLLKNDSIRVFLTVNPHSSLDNTSSVKQLTSGYSYTDVMGGTVSASTEHPIYTWNPDNVTAWPLSAWFDSAATFTKISNKLENPTTLTVQELADIGIDNTIELTRDASGTLCYYGDVSALAHVNNILSLPENSLVRYNAWAVYQSEDSDQWFYTQITPSAYTEFPWYFPRNLNAELREVASSETDKKTESFFSPYYWVYSYLPGEAFINEFNFNDNSGSIKTSSRHFVEICAPVNTNLGGWRVEMTASNSASEISESSVSIAPDTADTNKTLLEPDLGAVPYQRKNATSAQRSFYTAFTPDSGVYYREEGEEKSDLPKTKNAGVAERSIDYWYSLGSGHYASSVRLHRPTGGAEHIVCFSLNGEANVASATSQANLERLYKNYQAAYAEKGFGGEWEQTFTTGTWDDYISTSTPDSFGAADKITAKMHARRLVKADTFIANPAKDNRFALNATGTAYINDVANTSYANSIATVDMGGVFVTRKNAINTNVDNGPLDLTDVIVGNWPIAVNPTVQTRITEPEGGTENSDPVVQVTPRQINPDQYLVLYSGFSSSVVTSELSGRLGTHSLETFDENGALLQTSAAGRETPQTWGLSLNVASTALTYTAFPFHTVDTVTFRLKDASDPSKFITDATELQKVVTIINGECNFAEAAANEGWMTVTIPAGTAAVTIKTKSFATNDSELRYSVEAKGSFALDTTGGAARDVITQVHPYCGEGSADYPVPGSAKFQPWWGSNFGFEVAYDDAVLTDGMVLSSLIVTYPSPTALANTAWDGIKSSWTGWEHTYNVEDATVTAGLEGMEYADAIEFLKTQLIPNAGTRYVEMVGGANGRFADASLISTLGDAYAKAMGYDPTDAATAAQKEPAIPYCVWGVYTVTLNTSRGNEKVSFLMRQAMPGEKAGVWTMPDHYAPMTDLNVGKTSDATIPYFYLYSTPPQSAWVNEVNLVKGADEDADAFVEVVFPILREGILSATAPVVAQAEATGWSVRRYDEDGVASATYDCASAIASNSGSTSYKYLTMGMDPDTAARTKMAYVLHRPCGAAEGGVWVGKDDNGGMVTPAPDAVATNDWLIPATRSYIVAGQSDATQVAGSVQLVGQVVYRDGYARLSSAVAERTEWRFAAATQGSDNDGEMRPDTKPVWNQVTFTSALRNTVYAGTTCGYQLVPGAFDQENMVGETETITLTQAGRDWVYNDAVDGLVVSYRPRANYRFETMTLPAELMGKVMLVGRRGSLTAEQILERVTELKRLAVLDESKKLTDWVNLEGRASVEYRTVVDEAGAPVREPTGKIIFDTEFYEGEDEKGNVTTFGDMDNYVISIVFVEEPSSAQNVIEVAFGQGEVKTGAWMVTQTLYALDENGNPDPEKGGEAVTLPIWSDEMGNQQGDYANLHGWLYQPVAGDQIGMTAVINPDLGLQGGKISDPIAAMSAQNASLRPFLVWTAIPKTRVPTNLFDATAPNTALAMTRADFIKGWGLNTWLGSPSVQDGVTLQLSAVRRNLRSGAESTAATALYAKAGIIPMIYQGYCDTNGDLSTVADDDNRAAESLLSFRTMTEAELAEALANGETTGLSNEGTLDTDANPLLPYTAMIDMTDTTFWQDGAILRFAVVIADPVTGYIYDCQSISNFSSEAQEAYCPWYIPDETTNINRATSSTEAGGGISPFAWIYNIPQGSVWLNEFRPFAIANASGRVASAFELAMKASPLEDEAPANGIFKPTRTLDGWKVVTRYAPMPAYNSDPATPIAWQKHKEVPLYSWVPYRRVVKSLAESTGDASLYDNADFTLDFYTATVDPVLDTTVDLDATMTIMDAYYKAAVYKNADGTVNPDTFQWLNFNLKNSDTKSDFDLFDANLQATLTAKTDGAYADGVIYSIVLVRNNGAIEDEVIFYHTSPYAGIEGGDDYLLSRLNIAVESETVNNACAGVVRAVTSTALPGNSEVRQCTAQFVKYTNPQNESFLRWDVAPTTQNIYGTLSSPNTLQLGSSVLTQPYVEYATIPGATFERLEAGITGGDGATLELSNNGDVYTGRTVTTYAQMGSAYELTLKNWNTDWYKLSVKRNNEDFTPAGSTALATTYAVNAKTQAATTTTSLLIDSALVTASVSYNLVFTYTDDAALLAQAGELDSTDADFTAWLLQATPAEIAEQAEEDGVTAAEKYWLGATAPTDEVDAALNITAVGTFEENATEKPYVSVCLSNNGTRITEIVGDGNVVLLGKKKLSDAEWIYLQTLGEDDLAENAEIILSTDCKFFRAVLISDAALQALIAP